jgi:hypothetical protein
MPSTRLSLVLAVALLSVPAVSRAAEDYQSQGFEKPAFNAGPLAGQGEWRAVEVGGQTDDAVVQDRDVYQGQQAVELRSVGRRVVARLMQVRRETFYVDLYVKSPLPETILNNAALRLRGRDQQGQAGILVDVSFNGSGAINDIPRGPANQYTPGAWVRVTVKVDPKADTWSLYLDGKPLGVDMPVQKKALQGITQIDSFDLDWTSKPNITSHGLLVDGFSITSQDPLAAKPAASGK